MKGLLAVLIFALGVLVSQTSFEGDPPLRIPDPLLEGEYLDTRTNERGDRMVYRVFNQSQVPKPKAIVFFFHGMHSHTGETNIKQHMHNLSRHEIYIFALDQVGHGQTATDETRGYIETWNHFIDDAVHFIEEIASRPEYASVPFFIAGHSLGGAITIMTGLRVQDDANLLPLWKNWKGSILLAPPVLQNLSPSWIQIKALEFIHYLGGAMLPLGPRPDPTKFVSEESYLNFMTDPYTYSKRMRLGLGFTLLRLMDELQASVPKVKFPFIVFHGDADRVTLLAGSELLYEKSQTPVDKKKLVVFPGVRHNPMTEGVSREHAIPDTLEWMNQRIQE